MRGLVRPTQAANEGPGISGKVFITFRLLGGEKYW